MNTLLTGFCLTIVLLVLDVFGTSVNKVQLGLRRRCPPAENIPKCSCTVNPEGLMVTCKNFKEDTEFKAHLISLRGYYLEKLEINNYVASSMPDDIFKGLAIEILVLKGIEVNDDSFHHVKKRHFQGLEATLERLEIGNSFHGPKHLFILQLDHLQNLKEAVFERNNIPVLSSQWFKSGPKSLISLIFESNNIEVLGERTFDSLSNLKVLGLTGNDIRTLSRTMLPRAPNSLSSIDLAFNKIDNRLLPNDIFSGMPFLREVDLELNFLYSINQETWKVVAPLLKKVNFKGNPLTCNDTMKWMCATNLKEAVGTCKLPVEKDGVTLQQYCKG